MADFAGLRGSLQNSPPIYTERPQNFREMILWANPNGRAPLTALLARAKSESTDDPIFHWYEETQQLIRVTMDATGGDTDSTAFGLSTAGGGLKLVPGDVLLVEKADQTTYDNELVMVSEVTNDTTLVVKRGRSGTTGANTGASAKLTKVGNAYAEGSAAPNVSGRTPTRHSNKCQIFKTAVGETGTQMVTRMRTGDAWKNDKKRKSFDHSAALELAFLFGQIRAVDGDGAVNYGFEDTSGAYPLRFTGGIRAMMQTNVTVFATTPTTTTILNALYPVFDLDAGGAGDERIILAGNGALNTFNTVVGADSSSRVNYDGIIDVFGMKLQRWVTPQGSFGIRSHPLMNTHAFYKNSMFVINPMGLVYRHLRDTRFQDNIQNNDSDTRKGQWLTEAGLELHHQETFAYLGNVTNP